MKLPSRPILAAAGLLSLLVLVPSTALAQEVLLRGQVLDAETRRPVKGALVMHPESNQGALTDSLGTFGLRLERRQVYALRITQMGYAQMDIELPAEAESRAFTVVLPADPVVLEGLTVLTDALADRRRGPYGVADILTQAQLQTASEGTGYELVRRILPFVDLCEPTSEALCWGGLSRRGGNNVVTVCIDNRVVPPDVMETVLSTIDPRTLYLAEGYSRVGEVRLYTPAYIRQLLETDLDLPPLTFGCTGSLIPR